MNGYENIDKIFSRFRKREGLEDISRLSADCVGASSVNMFKNLIDISKNGGVHLDS